MSNGDADDEPYANCVQFGNVKNGGYFALREKHKVPYLGSINRKVQQCRAIRNAGNLTFEQQRAIRPNSLQVYWH